MKLIHIIIKLSYIRLLPHLVCYLLLNNKIKEVLKKDAERYYEYYSSNTSYPILFLRILNNFKEFRNIFYHRVSPSVKTYLSLFASPESNLHMTPYPKMKVAPGGILFQHPFSTIINANYIGEGCVFRHNTTLGNVNEDLDSVPTLLGNVNVGASCIIVGKITIGKNVIIGAGTVLTKDVPENSVVVGNPARIIKKDGVRCNIKL
jgi:serine O-acetyltransferase